MATPSQFVRSRLGLVHPENPLDWLTLTGQSVLEVTAGPIFHDGPGEFSARRQQLQWYPEPV